MPADPSYPIAELRQLLSERVQLNLSPIELAEILWLALQRSEGVPEPRPTGKPETLPESLPVVEAGDVQGPLVEPVDTGQAEEPKATVVTEPPQPKATEPEPGTALPVKIPEAIALRNRREIAKALRPLMRKVPSKTQLEIDEEATVTQIAEQQTWSPVVQPAPERWLELAIVIEVTSLLPVWQDTIAEFQHLMERHGAFRDVRTWQLQVTATGQPQLFLQTALGLTGKARSSKELLDAGGRRLVLLLSDCTSRAWRSGQIPQIIGQWSRSNPVTIVQLLPERYWDRSALGSGYLVGLRSRLPGALSRDWSVEGLSRRRRQRLRGGLKVPVVTMRPEQIGEWAEAMAAQGEQLTTGIVLDLKLASTADNSGQAASKTLTAKQLVRQFRGTASLQAQELADMMAVLPVNWSVIRLIQKNLGHQAGLIPETGALHLAEIVLSGLLQPSPVDGQVQRNRAKSRYEFVDGVREVLQSAIPISEAKDVSETIARAVFKQLPQEVQDRVSADIARRYGESLSYFQAFLIPNLPWGEEPAAEIFPFAEVTEKLLRRWGGDYAVLADDLKSGRRELKQQPTYPAEDLTLETLSVLEFETAQLIDTGEEFSIPELQVRTFEILLIDLDLEAEPSLLGLQLQPFEFEFATLEQKRQGFLRLQVKWVLQRQRQQARQWIESLGDGIELEMVAIPAGSFRMGSPRNESGRRQNEGPQHLVEVPAFLMGKYAVTQAQWRVVAALPQVNRALNPEPSSFKGDQRPVENVSWLEAVEFCTRLSNFTRRDYHLPSEAEWEYACRAGTSTPYHFGETINKELVNYSGGRTTDVGSFPPNAFGLHNMHGNVWEWCQDNWHKNYRGAPTNGSAWLTDNDNDSHIVRGGSWIYYPENCRSASRSRLNPGAHVNDIGFRVVLSAPRALT